MYKRFYNFNSMFYLKKETAVIVKFMNLQKIYFLVHFEPENHLEIEFFENREGAIHYT